MAGRTSSNRHYAHIEGLPGFLRSMGVLERNVQRAERVFQTLAASTVVTLAQQNAKNVGRQQASAAEDLKTIGAGTVQYGGKEWSFGAEFGSYVYGQFPIWRGNKDEAGYFFWPAIREFRDEELLELWVREVWSAVEGLFAN